jgi:hypothetical protein
MEEVAVVGRVVAAAIDPPRVREHGEVVVARRLEHRETGTAVLRGHRDRTGDPPPPPPPHRRRDLGFGLEPPPPPYPCLVICSSSALRQAWTSHRTTLGKKGKLASCAGEEVESGELRRAGENGGEEAERGKGKWRGGRGAREGSNDLAGRERSAGSASDAAGDGASYNASSRRHSGVRERDMPVAWSSDERAVVPGVGGVSCKIGILATPPSDALYMPLSATSQQYFYLTTNQPPATSQQYFSLRINQHQPPATSQTNRLLVSTIGSVLTHFVPQIPLVRKTLDKVVAIINFQFTIINSF